MSSREVRAAALFAALERIVVAESARGRWREAAAWSSVAGRLAATFGGFQLTSFPIEEALVAAGLHLDMQAPGAVKTHPSGRLEATPSRPAGRVLHVMSRVENPGGHTNWIRRWITADVDREHWLALTELPTDAIPDPLREAVQSSGGAIVDLAGGRDVLGRAAALRELSTHFRTALISTHPHDPVPSVAYSGWPGRPHVVTLDHADHLFWIGLCVADALVEYREVGAEWSRLHRGYPADRQVLVPLPVDVPRTIDKRRARAALGLDEDRFVAVSVGSPYKYRQLAGESFIGMVSEALRKMPALTVLLVGPEADDPALAGCAHSDRVLAVGRQLDLGPYFSAADVYLNSYPIGSTTAMLEGGAAGLPVISFRDSGLLHPLLVDDANCPDGKLTAGDPGELAALLVRLVEDASGRQVLGQQVLEHVRRNHSAGAWRSHIELAYEVAESAGPMSAGELVRCRERATNCQDPAHQIGTAVGWSRLPEVVLLRGMVKDRVGLDRPLRRLLGVVSLAVHFSRRLRQIRDVRRLPRSMRDAPLPKVKVD